MLTTPFTSTSTTAGKLAGPEWVGHLRPQDVDAVCEAFARMARELRDISRLVDRFTMADLPPERLVEDVIDLAHRVEAAGQVAKVTARRVRTRAILSHRRTEQEASA